MTVVEVVLRVVDDGKVLNNATKEKSLNILKVYSTNKPSMYEPDN